MKRSKRFKQSAAICAAAALIIAMSAAFGFTVGCHLYLTKPGLGAMVGVISIAFGLMGGCAKAMDAIQYFRMSMDAERDELARSIRYGRTIKFEGSKQ